MDLQASPSFIPKKPLTTESRGRSGGFGGLLFLLALLVFIASVVAGGATFLYGQYLHSAVTSKDDSLKRAEAAYDAGVIQDLTRLDGRIKEAKSLLDKHVAPSAFFDFLSGATLESVQFTSLSYELAADGSADITLDGVGKSFSAVALQSDQFSASRVLKNVVFSGIKVGSGGLVTFSVQASVDPALLIYRRSLTTGATTPAEVSTPTPPSPASTSTSPTSTQPLAP